jgi:serine/threonine protein kinase
VQLEVLGKGNSSVVYKAIHVPSLTLVASKVLRIYDEGKRHQMVREMKSLYLNVIPLATYFHSTPPAPSPFLCTSVIGFHDAFTNAEQGTVTIVTEYMNGGSLQDVIDKHIQPTEEHLAVVASSLLRGVAFLHEQRLIHRDIKPANILLSRPGCVKLSDFGLVCDLSETDDVCSSFVGTLAYLSPERVVGKSYTYSSDIWSVGLSLLTCAMGHFPYTEGDFWGLAHCVAFEDSPTLPPTSPHSPDLRDFLSLCLKKDPVERPTARQLLSHPFLLRHHEGDALDTPIPVPCLTALMPWTEENARLQLDSILTTLLRDHTQLFHSLVLRPERPSLKRVSVLVEPGSAPVPPPVPSQSRRFSVAGGPASPVVADVDMDDTLRSRAETSLELPGTFVMSRRHLEAEQVYKLAYQLSLSSDDVYRAMQARMDEYSTAVPILSPPRRRSIAPGWVTLHGEEGAQGGEGDMEEDGDEW